MVLCINWTTSDTINSLILIIYIITARVIYITFIEGKKQTAISLSISQFNIYYNELLDFFEDGKAIKLHSDLGDKAHPIIKDNIEKVDGINYIYLFLYAEKYLVEDIDDKNVDRIRNQINDFRHNILFPLEKYYDRLFHFLNSIYKDNILEKNHKNILFNKVERDILQTYFRICNYSFITNEKNYDLSTFDTPKYNSKSFYKINNLFIENKLFQYKSLEFYCKTN